MSENNNQKLRNFLNGSLLKIIVALLIGYGASEGMDYILMPSQKAVRNEVRILHDKVLTLENQVDANNKIIEQKLINIDNKLDHLDEKLQIMIDRK